MKLLAIETSSTVGSVALFLSDDEVGVIDFPEGTRHGRSLVPSIEQLLRKAGTKPEDLDVVAVSIGPGSYTGLRVGLVCAKMMCSISGLDLIAVPTLDVIAENARADCRHICVAGDARRNEVYRALYERTDNGLVKGSDYAIASPHELSEILVDGTCVIGDGVPVLAPALEGRDVIVADEGSWLPRADVVARLGAGLYTEGIRNDRYSTEPMYLRRPAAEEIWAERESGLA